MHQTEIARIKVEISASCQMITKLKDTAETHDDEEVGKTK